MQPINIEASGQTSDEGKENVVNHGAVMQEEWVVRGANGRGKRSTAFDKPMAPKRPRSKRFVIGDVLMFKTSR